ncbi:bactofilin family protein [Ideonella margarita]|uniref:Polymer-forming cytoskeletal protein n=1 Tax=Ideonella margarita TaxID=2984191 RepID=A0ABU9BZ15_9BURK
MWFSKKKQPPIRSLIGEGTAVHGELRFTDGLRIDGEVHGDVIAESGTGSLLVISENARVVGKVIAGHVIINGTVTGPVMSNELLELQPKARIVGDVTYESLEMHQGATIDGGLQHRAAGTKLLIEEDKQPPLKLAASNES